MLVPTIRKEIHFFDYDPYFEQGVDWYSALFDHHTNETAIGEVTPGYFAIPEAAERIHALLPDVKIILSLRNPAERAYSSYMGYIQTGKISKDVDIFSASEVLDMDKKPRLLDQGHYYEHLQRYLNYFSKEQLLILFYDDLKEDSASYIKKIYEFIGVDSTFVPSVISSRVNEGTYSEALRLVIRGARNVVPESYRMKTIRRLRKLWRKRAQKRPDMPADLRERLVNYYRDEVDHLERFLHVDLSEWKR